MAEIDLGPKLLVPEHPLLIEKIFTNITKYLAYPEMIKCGVVCKQWFVVIDPILRARQPFSNCGPLGPNLEKVNTALAQISGLSSITICCAKSEDIQEMFTLLLDHPKAQYLSRLALTKCTLSKESFETLIFKYGHTLKELQFHTLEHVATTKPNYHPFPILKAGTATGTGTKYSKKYSSKQDIIVYPDMKQLRFTGFGNVSISVHGICLSFPNLVELLIHGISIPFTHKTQGHNLALPYLKKLSIALAVSSNCRQLSVLIIYFMNMNLKLVDLELLVFSIIDLDLLKFFLQDQASSLETFTLMNGGRATDPGYVEIEGKNSLEFPKLLKLKKLFLDGFYIQKLTKTLKPLENLESLELEIFCFDKWKRILPSSSAGNVIHPILSVKKLLFEVVIAPNEFRTMCKLFPATEFLNLDYCTDEHLKIIYAELNGLNDLRINGTHGELTDSGFLGISLEDCEKLRAKDPDVLELVRNVSPSIRDMKKLANLTIICCHLGTVSELTLVYGIVDIPNLKYISCERIYITTEAHQAFVNKGLQVLEIAYISPTNAIQSFKYVKPIPIIGEEDV